MRHLETTMINALKNHRFPLPLLWEKVTALPLDAVDEGFEVEPRMEVELLELRWEVLGLRWKPN
jgi:hypothetical protein